ncbi:MAG: 50S ribosomal protein L1 [Bacilli bacterium]|nr:50S ribosomal protein L1 [Bacilli bacterium]MCQ2794441.1 50S ribosomal protein L1 [Bacilli bacterium]
MKRGKKYLAAAKLVDANKLYSLSEASALVKKTNTTKFDATVDLSIKLNVDTKQPDQMIRGTIVLPHGNGKTVRVLALTNKVDEAKAAGADYAGAKEMIEKITKESWFDYDVIVATPDMMGEIGKIGRILGPKGLMPNPKSGTVSPDIKKAVKEIKAGKVEYRVDKDGNINLSCAKVSFEEKKIAENLQALCDAIVRSRPLTVKGKYITNAAIHTTMGPSIHITFEGRDQ